MATNNSPGQYTVVFDPALAGSKIEVFGEIPALEGGGVFINGDVDADGRPDITVLNRRATSSTSLVFGFRVTSGGNRLHALAVRGFSFGVHLSDDDTGQSLSNSFTGLVLETERGGIVHDSCGDCFANMRSKQTHTTWLDTRIVGNTIESQGAGIEFHVHFAIGDVVDRILIANNSINIDQSTEEALFGIGLGMGFWSDSKENRLSNGVIAYNSILGDPSQGMLIGSGMVGATDNSVTDLRIIGNTIDISERHSFGAGRTAIALLAGDGATDFYNRSYSPIGYPSRNVLSNVQVSGNTMKGEIAHGVYSFGACCGGSDNVVDNVRIYANVIHLKLLRLGLTAGVQFMGGHTGDAFSKHSEGNAVSTLSIRNNLIQHETEEGTDYVNMWAGGVSLIGANGGRSNVIESANISNNRIDTDLIGLNLVGGVSERTLGAEANQVRDVSARCNLIVKEPVIPMMQDESARGLSVIGGISLSDEDNDSAPATGNRVECLNLRRNMVAGTINDTAWIPDFGPNASGNSISSEVC